MSMDERTANSERESPLLIVLRETSEQVAYRRIYPGLSWEEASDVGRVEARQDMRASDVFEAVRILITPPASGSTPTDGNP